MLTDSCLKFALESLKKCTVMEPKTNVFFSPHLIYQNLLVMYFGVTNDVEESLKRVLCIPDVTSKAIVEQYYLTLGVNQFCYIINGFDNCYTCRVFSRFFINDTKMLYVETLSLFSSGHQVKEIHFSARPDRARIFINNSIKVMTQNHIQNLLPSNAIDVNTDAALLNTIYCKGQLQDSFDFDSERKNKKNNILKETNYKSEKLDAFIIEVPVKDEEISIFFLFPSQYLDPDEDSLTESDRIIQLLERLTTDEGLEELRKLLNDGISEQTDIVFPIFKIEHDLRIHELLNMLGVPDFMPDLSMIHLSEFGTESLKLGDAIHRTSIELTKNNITATASNIFFTYNACDRVQEDPKAVDYFFPCISLIYDRIHRSIIFCGVLWES